MATNTRRRTGDSRATAGAIRGRGDIRGPGFTLIELLVVITIVALLLAILLPALSMARKTAWAANSLSNMRQWGIGTHAFLHDHKFILPWEGEKQDIGANYPEALWWGNAVPPYVGQKAYAKIFAESFLAGRPVPKPPTKNIFIDPSAQIGQEQLGGLPIDSLPYYFSYAWNADLAEGGIRPVVINGLKRLRYDDIRHPTRAILFFELRAGAHELEFVSDEAPYAYEKSEADMLRMKGDEKHFAGRHMQGGHLAYADGHAAHRKWVESYEANDWAADGTTGD